MVLQSLTIDEQTEANQIILLTATNTTFFLQIKIKIYFPKRKDFFLKDLQNREKKKKKT